MWSGEVQDFLRISEDEYKKTMKVNVVTPFLLMKAIARRFQGTKSGGSVVFLTQIIGAERGLYPGAAAYGTSLGAIHQLVRVSMLVFHMCPFSVLLLIAPAQINLKTGHVITHRNIHTSSSHKLIFVREQPTNLSI